jgi:hypothetical protein
MSTNNSKRKRPTSLTILGWYFIVGNAVALLYQPLWMNSPKNAYMLSHYRLPVWATIASAMIVAALHLVSGIGILKGFEWGRSLYMGGLVFAITMSVLNMPMPYVLILIPATALSALFVWPLYRQAANAYFQR